MSLYISGVPLPKLGPVFLRIEPSGAVVEHDDNTGEEIIVGKAIDISGHGRLIDADDDPSEYVTVWDCECSEFGKQTVMSVDDLAYLPTIITGEEVDNG